jgi:hypothetical protein
MPKWEYMYVELPAPRSSAPDEVDRRVRRIEQIEQILNGWGQWGWEAVGMTPNEEQPRFLLKRPIAAEHKTVSVPVKQDDRYVDAQAAALLREVG